MTKEYEAVRGVISDSVDSAIGNVVYWAVGSVVYHGGYNTVNWEVSRALESELDND